MDELPVLRDFVFVPKDKPLCFYIETERGERRYYWVAAFDLEPLKEASDIGSFKTGKTLRVFEYFGDPKLQCQEPWIDSCICPELDPRQQPQKDLLPDTKVEKTPLEREDQFKMDMGV